jgi:NAD(P)-dependent dehydrogenase (short-subunit alcohol dehydrogenase family)
VTGATSGIGAAAALGLARLGGTVAAVGRDPRRCARAAERIRRGAGGARVETFLADLSSQAQVRRLAQEIRERLPRVDVLVNDAGGVFRGRETSADGLEMTFALNHLAPFLLTALLLDRLEASPAGRVVVVSSSAHERGSMRFDDLQGERRYDRLEAYAQSKLANLLFTYELARRLRGTRVTANALHPGEVATRLGGNDGRLRALARNLLKPGMLTPEQGAETVVYLASSPEVEGVSGRYFHRCREVRSSDASRDEAAAARLWQVSEELTGLRRAGGPAGPHP